MKFNKTSFTLFIMLKNVDVMTENMQEVNTEPLQNQLPVVNGLYSHWSKNKKYFTWQ